ncbi:unnamed protein product [Rotaria sordida]|uniref:Uncharacterized protein n=1 Tax=Rotaria sordida TaxID=392033 RepID=A0A815DLJ0_9BILA|nr:unnamed protein product [Rotaria sordida]CAF3747485.1 unnamed protein product [Rotaria sordida]
MIPVLRSIDTLLNRFDELSKCHKDLLSNFDKNISDIENPLRDIARPQQEQQKTTPKILLLINENDQPIESIRTIENFHQHIIKNRYLYRPPTYSSNHNNLLIHRIPSKISSITTESTSLSQTKIQTRISQSIAPTSNKFINEAKIKPKIIQQNSFNLQRYTRNKVTTFSKETINRLSKPKTYHQLLDEKSRIKRIERRLKPYENIKQEKSECSTSLSISLPPIKRIQTTNIKAMSKRLPAKNNILIQRQKSAPINNFSRPLVFIKPAPTINLTFPKNLKQQSPRFVI